MNYLPSSQLWDYYQFLTLGELLLPWPVCCLSCWSFSFRNYFCIQTWHENEVLAMHVIQKEIYVSYHHPVGLQNSVLLACPPSPPCPVVETTYNVENPKVIQAMGTNLTTFISHHSCPIRQKCMPEMTKNEYSKFLPIMKGPKHRCSITILSHSSKMQVHDHENRYKNWFTVPIEEMGKYERRNYYLVSLMHSLSWKRFFITSIVERCDLPVSFLCNMDFLIGRNNQCALRPVDLEGASVMSKGCV